MFNTPTNVGNAINETSVSRTELPISALRTPSNLLGSLDGPSLESSSDKGLNLEQAWSLLQESDEEDLATMILNFGVESAADLIELEADDLHKIAGFLKKVQRKKFYRYIKLEEK